MKVTDEMIETFMGAKVCACHPMNEIGTRLQAVLDLIAPEPNDRRIELPVAERVSNTLTEARTVLGRVDTALFNINIYPTYREDPEWQKIAVTLDTVREMLEPWARKGWKRRTDRGPR